MTLTLPPVTTYIPAQSTNSKPEEQARENDPSTLSKPSSFEYFTYIAKRLTSLSNKTHICGYPKDRAILKAFDFALSHLSPGMLVPSVVPEDGSVLFVWKKSNWVIEIEIWDGPTELWAKNFETEQEESGEFNQMKDTFFGLIRDLSSK